MYNAELKNEFLMSQFTNDSTRHSALVLFNTLEPYERAWGADVCTKSAEELRQVLSGLVGMRVASQNMRTRLLKLYGKWCIERNVPGVCDGLLNLGNLSPDMLDKMRRQTVANPTHLQRYLDCVCDPESDETVDCLVRCYCWLAYGGLMREKDIEGLTTGAVDLESMLVHVNGESYAIYREALPAFRNCVNLTQFNYTHPSYNKPAQMDRIKKDLLLRSIKGDVSVGGMRSMFYVLQREYRERGVTDKSLDLRLSYYRIWLSGLFYRMSEWERAGGTVDFIGTAYRAMAEKKRGSKEKPPTTEYTQRQERYTATRIAKDYAEDYNRWKEIYSI